MFVMAALTPQAAKGLDSPLAALKKCSTDAESRTQLVCKDFYEDGQNGTVTVDDFIQKYENYEFSTDELNRKPMPDLFKGLYLKEKNSSPVSIYHQAILTIIRPGTDTSFTDLQKAMDGRKHITLKNMLRILVMSQALNKLDPSACTQDSPCWRIGHSSGQYNGISSDGGKDNLQPNQVLRTSNIAGASLKGVFFEFWNLLSQHPAVIFQYIGTQCKGTSDITQDLVGDAKKWFGECQFPKNTTLVVEEVTTIQMDALELLPVDFRILKRPTPWGQSNMLFYEMPVKSSETTIPFIVSDMGNSPQSTRKKLLSLKNKLEQKNSIFLYELARILNSGLSWDDEEKMFDRLNALEKSNPKTINDVKRLHASKRINTPQLNELTFVKLKDPSDMCLTS